MNWTGLALLAVLGGTALLCAKYHFSPHPLEAEFERFIQKWDKKYASTGEKAKRFLIFADNFAFVMAENAKNHKYKLTMNEFADLTADEFGASHFGVSKPEKIWGDLPYLGQHKYSGATLPDSVDWESKGAVTDIKNQGQCGSCWAFSTTGSLEGAWEIATGKLVSLSEQQFVDCSKSYGNMGCNGGLMDNAFKYAEKNALCTEKSYPYTAKGGTCEAASCTVGIPEGGVTGFKDVEPKDLQSLEEAVAQQPVSIAIEADQRVFQLYHTGVLSGTCGTKLDHGVLVVGYGTLDGTDYWKVKNSWGSSWGEEGYILLEKGKNSAGECGIKMQPSYPVVSGKPVPPGPSPPPAPPSPPSPSTSHYEKPPCQSDETQASVQGANGDVCAPKCDASGQCPSDVPPGTTDTPQCVLQDQSGDKYCALTCILGGCPTGAKCAHIGGIMGICVYPESDSSIPKKTLTSIPKDETTIAV